MSPIQPYTCPQGLHEISHDELDLRSDELIDKDLQNPPPVTSDKNIWFFWHSGIKTLHPYTLRNVRAQHRRLSKRGWTIRVLDKLEGSPLHISNYLDTSDVGTFPQSFIDGTLSGPYALQHVSDLVRFPLLIRYGGVYADVGFLQIGDLDWLWRETVGNPNSPYEVISYNDGSFDMTNYFLASSRGNILFEKFHALLLALWAEDGGKTSTEGMHSSSLLEGVPLMGKGLSFEEGERLIEGEEMQILLTDYIIQGQAMSMVLGLVDAESGWDGPRYFAEKVYCIEFMVGSQLINELTAWDGPEAFRLLSLELPGTGEEESGEQTRAREIVESCLGRSFGFKLAHGLIIRVLGPTLGSLWRQHAGSDDIPGTYAHWLRYGMVYWSQDLLPRPVNGKIMEPLRRGRLLGGIN